MMTLKLRDHSSAQCHVNCQDDAIDFISYKTRVISIRIENGVRMVECTGTYSRTTAKQIGWFLREYASDLNYYMMKEIAQKGFVAI